MPTKITDYIMNPQENKKKLVQAIGAMGKYLIRRAFSFFGNSNLGLANMNINDSVYKNLLMKFLELLTSNKPGPRWEMSMKQFEE